MKTFSKIIKQYRVRIDLLDKDISYISNNVFESYESAWNYAKKNSKEFGNCGFCVIYEEMPELIFNGDSINAWKE